jgi:hypothetical protein
MACLNTTCSKGIAWQGRQMRDKFVEHCPEAKIPSRFVDPDIQDQLLLVATGDSYIRLFRERKIQRKGNCSLFHSSEFVTQPWYE